MKKIGEGKIFLLIWAFCCSFLHSVDKNIRLYIQDMDQNPIRQIEKGVPFLLQVVVDNVQGVQLPDDIAGFENFKVTRYGASQSTNIINGQRADRMIFNYGLNAENLGNFSLGPVLIRDKDGVEISSDVVHVVVGDKTIAHSVKKTPYFLEAQVDKKLLYIGEELLVKIRFYYANEYQNLQFIDAKFDDFIAGEIIQNNAIGKENIRGGEYNYREWLIKLYPQKTGTLIVQSVQAVFRVAADFSQNLMGIFDMFGMSSEKRVQSAARSVDVVPLPESKMYKDVTAVGQFDQAIFALKQHEAEVGEGIVATCTVSGVGNFEMIKAPLLQLPMGLKYYDANSSLRKLENGKQEKTFEYIVQAEHSGDFLINSQQFVYFDPVKKSYKTLPTQEVKLKISGEVISPALNIAQEGIAPKGSHDAVASYVFKEGEINYVIESGLVSVPVNSMVDKFLSLLIKLLMVLVGLSIIVMLYKNYIEGSWSQTYWGYYICLQWQLYSITRKQSVAGLYGLFEQLSNRFDVELQSAQIVDAFKRIKMSDSEIKDWQMFLKEMFEFVFDRQEVERKKKQQIIQNGQYWIKKMFKALSNT